MINFRNMIKSLKAIWVQRLLMSEWKNSANKWVKIASNMIGAENKELLLSKQHLDDISFPIWCCKFFKPVLKCWFDFHSKESETYCQVLQESLQYNTFLKIGNKQIKDFIF